MRPSNRSTISLCLLATVLLAGGAHAATTPLQLFIDLTPVGGTLRPLPGVYAGPVVIDKPMTLDGGGEVTIDGGGAGTVLTIGADSAVVRGLRLTGSGVSHDKVDAGVLITGRGSLVEGNTLDKVLFGIHLSQADGNTLRANSITSREGPATLRGDGIRVWYSRGNLIEDNALTSVRDMIFTNSPDNRIVGNRIVDGRIGMELIFSPRNEIAGNHLVGNEHGIVGIYSDSLFIRDNRIEHQSKLSGSALAVKGSAQTRIEGNQVLDCAVGLTANSPTHPDEILYVRGNEFAYNDVALYFYGEKGGHVVRGNRFVGNFQQVLVTGPTSALANDWSGNYWQDYGGFDRDGDGYGDTPYTVYLFSDRLWMDRGQARFFRGSPVLELIDFVERLAPFSDPVMILEDPRPRMR